MTLLIGARFLPTSKYATLAMVHFAVGSRSKEIDHMLKQRIVHASFISFLSLHVALAASLSHAADTTNELLVRVPPSANAVAVVDVEGLFKSKLGLKQSWSRSYYTDYANGLVAFPPTVQTSVLAAKINPDTISAD